MSVLKIYKIYQSKLIDLNTCDFVIGKDANQNIKIILTKKKAA